MPVAATATPIRSPRTCEDGMGSSTYDLVVLLQHAIEDCERYQRFARDARADDDEELASFFDELALNDHGVASRARHLLAARL